MYIILLGCRSYERAVSPSQLLTLVFTVSKMAVTASSTQAGPSASQSQGAQNVPQSIEQLMQLLLSDHVPSQLNQTLKNVAKEPVLLSLLPGGQDPLDLLQPQTNTLGCLYILCVPYILYDLLLI